MAVSKIGLIALVYISYVIISVAGHPHDEDTLHAVDHESHLYFHILDDHHYVRHLRPAAGPNDTLVVKLSVAITGIADLDESSQELGATLMLKASWKDPRLTWNTSEFGEVTRLSVPAAIIWKPDFTMLHSMYGSFEHFINEMATVAWTGEISLTSHYRVRTRCPVDITDFPFDSHVCAITLVDTYSSQQVKLHFLHTGQDRADGQSYVGTTVASQWEVTVSPHEKTIGRIIHPELVDYVSLTVNLHRKSDFYHCVVIGPAVLIALLVPVIFLLPVDTTGKISLGSGIMITLMVSLKLLCDVIGPNRSAAPRIAMFYVITLALTSISVIMAAVVNTTARKGSTRKAVPVWLRMVFLGRCGLRRWLCMEPYSNVDHTANFASMKIAGDYQEHESDVTPLKDSDTDLKEVTRNLRMLVGRYSVDQVMKDVDSEWREIALVIDRLMFIVFVIMFMLTTLSLLT